MHKPYEIMAYTLDEEGKVHKQVSTEIFFANSAESAERQFIVDVVEDEIMANPEEVTILVRPFA